MRRLQSTFAFFGCIAGLTAFSAAQQDSPQFDAEPGVTINEPGAYAGYSLISSMRSTSTYLIDMEGRIVNQWDSDCTPALSVYLLPNGHLLRPGASGGGGFGFGGGGRGGGGGGGGPSFGAPGAGGRIQEFDWDGNLVWDFDFHEAFPDSKLRPHHDICPLPSGNVLVVCSDPKTKEESIAAGRLPTIAPNELLADAILEIKPVGEYGGEIVWAWYAWDHLVQDVHDQKENYADVSEHPHRIDVNFATGMMDRMLQDPEQLARLRSLGYVGGGTRPSDEADEEEQGGRGGFGFGGPGGGGDWMHINSVAYNETLDQIMVSVHEFSEVWVIDHSTTTEEAATSSGGQFGKGGDLLYRWGNPKAYRCGTNIDQRLFAQHCAHWIADGLPGAGNMLVFNNGSRRPDGTYSSVDEIVLPMNSDGSYAKEEYVAFEPYQAEWKYGSPETSEFFSMMISGAQRLPNGNTFICSGAQSTLFEVTPEGEVVWQYKHAGGGMGGFPGFGGGPPQGFGGAPQGFGGPQRGGAQRGGAQRGGAQRGGAQRGGGQRGGGQRGGGQRGGDRGQGFPPRGGDQGRGGGRGFGGGQGGGFGGGPGGGGPGGGFGGRGGGGMAGMTAMGAGIFRCYRYGEDYPGLADKDLTPGELLVDVATQESGPGGRGGNRRPPIR